MDSKKREYWYSPKVFIWLPTVMIKVSAIILYCTIYTETS